MPTTTTLPFRPKSENQSRSQGISQKYASSLGAIHELAFEDHDSEIILERNTAVVQEDLILHNKCLQQDEGRASEKLEDTSITEEFSGEHSVDQPSLSAAAENEAREGNARGPDPWADTKRRCTAKQQTPFMICENVEEIADLSPSAGCYTVIHTDVCSHEDKENMAQCTPLRQKEGKVQGDGSPSSEKQYHALDSLSLNSPRAMVVKYCNDLDVGFGQNAHESVEAGNDAISID